MLALIITISCVFIDQITKFLVLQNLKGSSPIIVIENLLTFTYVENRGAAFGILQNKKWFFVVITVVSVLILLYVLFNHYNTLPMWLLVSLSLILGGTIGNFIDRMRLGFVVDFISVRFFNRYNFAVFNLADSFIVVGAFMLMIYILFLEQKRSKWSTS